MAKPKLAYIDGILSGIQAAENARLDRPRKPAGAARRRCGDVIRWEMNNETMHKYLAACRKHPDADVWVSR